MPSHAHAVFRVAIASLTTCALSVFAQQPAPTPAPSKPDTKPTPAKPEPKPETIEVKSSGEYDERRDDTATKIVVNSAEINKYGDTQVLDVLKRLPGITVNGNQVRMRGLGQGYTQILVDGERPPPGFSLEQLSPTLIERIEVVRAATAEFSTQAIAGTINIVLKKKVSFAQRDLRLNYSQGSFFKSPNVNFVVSDKAGDIGYTVAGTVYTNRIRFEQESFETAADAAGRPILDRHSTFVSAGDGAGFNVAPRIMWSQKGGDSFNWQGFFNTNKGDRINSLDHVRADGIPVPVYRSESKSEFDNQFMRSDLNWIRKLDGNGKLDMKVLFMGFRNENENVTKGFNAAGQHNLDRSSHGTSNENALSTTGKLSKPLIEGHAFVAGWDMGRARREQSNRQLDVPVPGVFPPVLALDRDERFDATVDKAAFFAQDEWNVTKDWSVYLGLRWEGIRTTSEVPGFGKARNTSSVWTPLMQTLYKLPSRPGEQVRLALTRTYKAPNAGSLVPTRFSTVDNKPTSPDTGGNPNLKPELATGIDAAYEKFWGQGSSMSLSMSARRITDYNRTGLILEDGRWVSLPINDGKAYSRSLEFDTKFPVQSVWKDAPPLDFRFNLNRNWSKVDSVPGPDNRLDQQVPFSSTLGLDYRMKGGIVVAGGNFTYQQGGDVRISANQTIFQTAKRDLDVYALWKISPKVQTRLTLANILKPDTRNETAYFDENGSNNNLRISPSKMTVRATLELKL